MDWVSHASASKPFIIDSLSPIPDLNAVSTDWKPFEQQASNAFVLDTAATAEQPLPGLRPLFLALDDKKVDLPKLESPLGESSTDEEPTRVQDWEAGEDEDENGDPWAARDVIRGLKVKKLLSWDNFLDPTGQTGRAKSLYLSESPLAFEAALDAEVSRKEQRLPEKVARQNAVVRCLLEATLGRESALYRYDGAGGRFVSVTEFGIPGISPTAQGSVAEEILGFAGCVRRLDTSIGESYSDRTLVALSAALSTVLQYIKAKIETEKVGVSSMLQLEYLFSRPKTLLRNLEELYTSAKAGDGLLKLIERFDALCASQIGFAPLLTAIFEKTMAPSLAELSNRTGLSRSVNGHTSQGPAFTCEALVAECERCLQVLGTQSFCATDSVEFVLRSTWEEIDDARREARLHEFRQSQSSVVAPEQTKPYENLSPPSAHVLIDIDARNLLGRHLSEVDDGMLTQLTTKALSADSTDSPLSRPTISQSISLSLTPLLSAQARLLSFRTLRLLIKDHSLLTHISLLNRFMLMTDGLFTTRLSQALFSSDLSTGAGRRIEEGRTGLRLQTRETWPPASSELRLVLMGILSESYGNAELPRGLSFAIRELSDEELEACRDLESVSALDFLKIQYKPELALGEIITDGSLERYDRVFRLMLRLLRMRALTQSLVREVARRKSAVVMSQRIRLSMLHFVNSLTSYVYEATMSYSRPFEDSLANLEDKINKDDYKGTISQAPSLLWLQKEHDSMLDCICTALFLDDRISHTIDQIFALILRFSNNRTNPAQIQQEFTNLTKTLIRDLGQKKPQEPFDRLLIRLDAYS